MRSPSVLAGLVVAAGLAAPPSAGAFEFRPAVEAGDARLELRGTSLFRYKGLFKVNSAALYLPANVPSGEVFDDVPKRLEFAYHRSLAAEDLVASGNTFLRKNVSEAEWAALQPALEKVNAAYRAVTKGDRYSLTYVPGAGTTLALNGEAQCRIEDPAFARLYFRIWLGDHPVSEGFRDELLAEGRG